MADELDDAIEAFNAGDEATPEGPTPDEPVEAAPDSDAPAADDAEAAAPDDGDGKEQPPAKGRSEKLQKIIDSKFGGDEDAFTDSLYEQWNSGSRMRQELDEVKGALAQLVQQRPPESIPDDHPDLVEINEELTSLKDERKSNSLAGTRLLNELGTLDREIAKLEGKAESAEDFEKQRLEQKILQLEVKKESLIGKWESSNKDDKRLERELKSAEKRLNQAKKDVSEKLVSEQRQQRADLQVKERTLQEFFQNLEAAADENGIPKEARKHLANTVRGELVLFLRGLGPDEPDVDLPAAVKARVAAYAKAMNLAKPKASTVGKEKIQAQQTGKVPPQPGAPPPAAPKQGKQELKFKNAAEAKAWTAKMLP